MMAVSEVYCGEQIVTKVVFLLALEDHLFLFVNKQVQSRNGSSKNVWCSTLAKTER